MVLSGAKAKSWLEIAGPDRVRFIQNLVTADVAKVGVGSSVRGFFTSVQGRVLADFDLLVFEDRLRLRLPDGRGPAIVAHLTKYRIAERVEITDRPELETAELRGSRAAELLAVIGIEAPSVPGDFVTSRSVAGEIIVRAALRGREPRFELTGLLQALDATLDQLQAEERAVPIAESFVSEEEANRIEEGELRWGVDYGEESFPQETGEESAVSYTKGCYLGQEIVARLHYRGQPQRVARGLLFPEGEDPEPGVELALDGRPAARATSVAFSVALGRPIGLALVHRRAAEPGTRLVLADGAEVEVVALPFVVPESV